MQSETASSLWETQGQARRGDGKHSSAINSLAPCAPRAAVGPRRGLWPGPGSCPGAARQLSFPVLGSDPYIHVKGYEAGWIHLVCRSVGWFPRPWAEWRDPQGKVLPSETEATSLDKAGLFETAISSKVEDSTVGSVSCAIRNVALGQEKTVAMVMAGKG